MSENERKDNGTLESAIRDIAKEFNVIVDSVKDDKSDFVHDRYFRFAFAEPKRMAELLTLFSRHNPTLKAFLETIDLKTLRGSKENFSSDKHTGSADLVFEANLKNGGVTGLYVGIIAEHKSTNKDDVLLQISEYYHHLFLERKKDVPVVAFIVYNGEKGWNPLAQGRFEDYPEYYRDIGYPFKVEFLDVGHAIDDAELKDFSPITLVALTAMRYIWDVEKFSVSFREAALHLLKMQNTDEGRDFIKQSLSYFFWKWPYKSEVIKMDSPEALKNKGYETFGEHFFNAGVEKGIEQGFVQGVEKGVEQERKKNEIESAARDKKIEDFLRSKGVSAELLKEALAIK
ncbi:Rpn family recombination-promoting nuclease/putative transposase [Fibrobacter sp. UWB12]|uniref:Rpn family recombination-promoting nuclease/putative transposase n=1 Tax=Fibrobacter sp. UWB12 TaxID=1896203 RepID=UPI0009183AD1|nr:Rpn family recombination-promoting nuclease/putative transposase [Fibrobacter sp. UWB12]SHK67778.1 Putative transposase, YhgA-like [Fibrobacter sp. UWB12]